MSIRHLCGATIGPCPPPCEIRCGYSRGTTCQTDGVGLQFHLVLRECCDRGAYWNLRSKHVHNTFVYSNALLLLNYYLVVVPNCKTICLLNDRHKYSESITTFMFLIIISEHRSKVIMRWYNLVSILFSKQSSILLNCVNYNTRVITLNVTLTHDLNNFFLKFFYSHRCIIGMRKAFTSNLQANLNNVFLSFTSTQQLHTLLPCTSM